MFLSVDIGGTKTLLALFNARGACLKRLKFKTEKRPSIFVNTLSDNLQAFLPNESSRRAIKAITIAIPGVVKNESNSYSFQFGNLDWPDIDLISPIKKLFSCKIFFVNDADLATLYESSRPSCKTGKSVYLTFSTGIGGGLAKNGRLLESSSTFEPGHIKYVYMNRSSEWEDIASAGALSKAYNATFEELTLNDAILKDLITRLSLGLVDIINEESPKTIIIGGPLAFVFKKFKQPLAKHLIAETNNHSFKLKRAWRPTESVIYGAYLYSKQHCRG